MRHCHKRRVRRFEVTSLAIDAPWYSDEKRRWFYPRPGDGGYSSHSPPVRKEVAMRMVRQLLRHIDPGGNVVVLERGGWRWYFPAEAQSNC